MAPDKAASSTPTSPTIHPAQTVSNIRNLIPLTLDPSKVQYHSWVELFQVAARAHCVIDHIDDKNSPDPTISKDKWDQLDAIVLSWIYGSITEDLLLTIIKPGLTAREAWLRLKDLFQDNKTARAADLENQFNHVKLENFSFMASYCQHLKMLSDQLSDVDQSVGDQRLVLQLINGLSREYDTVGPIISNSNPLPSFATARSMLLREETRRGRHSESQSGYDCCYTTIYDCCYTTIGLAEKLGGNLLPTSNVGSNLVPTITGQTIRLQIGLHSPGPLPIFGEPHGQYRLVLILQVVLFNHMPLNAGILGPSSRPQALHTATSDAPSVQLTDLPQAFSAMTLQPPDDSWYMDTGASSHMAANTGIFHTISRSSVVPSVSVGNGNRIPVVGSGTAYLTPHLTLPNVLHTPHIIKNLVSVRQFTKDNNVSVEFDPFGFSVKDLQTRGLVMRCNSSGDLYTVRLLPPTSTSYPVSLATLSSQTWHHRLGHPGDHVFSFLRNKNMISCNKEQCSTHLCASCQIAKHKRLPFSLSLTSTYAPFHIISDLWTSPVLSKNDHRYYLVLLDDFTYFVWVYPLKHKTEVYDKFIQFCTLIKTQFECDMGREFDNSTFHSFCQTNRILFCFSCPQTSPQNGKAERIIRTLNDISRTLLIHASLPPNFWVASLHMATYLHNILPTKILNYATPTQASTFVHPLILI
ncbi:LOW QUALITY PROTEIN: hypothetical protein OSB04_010350 [Centaurea solstitialis]|uniref:Integrase catalytic domain-containing protein n=1 Tax=Centaurea solstitialis TaxID=347529 RepID=A0AA38TKK5_9ASTR|nr:LOW QUALITY PROTEIN: hypothetical protein OSB04_010350 [Centaurea solstitialis]